MWPSILITKLGRNLIGLLEYKPKALMTHGHHAFFNGH